MHLNDADTVTRSLPACRGDEPAAPSNGSWEPGEAQLGVCAAAKLAATGIGEPGTPDTTQGRALLTLEAASPRTVAILSASSQSDPPTPHGPGSTASSSAGGGSGCAAASATSSQPSRAAGRSSLGSTSLTPVGSATDLEQPPLEVDLDFLCDRLKRGPLTGQVVAWGWDQAARLCLVQRTMPNRLFSCLWAATDACVHRMTAQDIVEILASWLTIMQQCPRHFRLAVSTMDALATYTLPAAGKQRGGGWPWALHR